MRWFSPKAKKGGRGAQVWAKRQPPVLGRAMLARFLAWRRGDGKSLWCARCDAVGRRCSRTMNGTESFLVRGPVPATDDVLCLACAAPGGTLSLTLLLPTYGNPFPDGRNLGPPSLDRDSKSAGETRAAAGELSATHPRSEVVFIECPPLVDIEMSSRRRPMRQRVRTRENCADAY